MKNENVKVSKFLSYVLRHKPGAIGLELDDQGWALIDDIIAKADTPIDRDAIELAVANNNKQRFAISEDGARIRARQGHSIKVDLGLAPQTPPEVLYHGTATRFLESIMAQGLKPGSRQHVHLSADLETARQVGQRHGKVIVLQVLAADMAATGHPFYQSENGFWLTKPVPAKWLKLLD